MSPFLKSLRRASSILLTFSFLAMASSGLLMLLIHGLGFQVRMHPVHNIFGLIMIVAGIVHVAFNMKALLAYLKVGWAKGLAVLMAVMLVLLYAAGLHKPVDSEAIRQIDEIMAKGRGGHQ